MNVNKYRNEIIKMQSDADLMYQEFAVFELDIVEEEYQNFCSEINEIELILKDLDTSDDVGTRNRLYDLDEKALSTYKTLI